MASIKDLVDKVLELNAEKAELEQIYEDALGHLRAANEGLKQKLQAEKAETIKVLETLKRAAKEFDDCCEGRLIEHGQFMFVHSEDCPMKLVKPLLDKLKGESPTWGPDHPSYDEMGQ